MCWFFVALWSKTVLLSWAIWAPDVLFVCTGSIPVKYFPESKKSQSSRRFCHRTAESIVVNVHGQNQVYQILAVNSFNSTRRAFLSQWLWCWTPVPFGPAQHDHSTCTVLGSSCAAGNACPRWQGHQMGACGFGSRAQITRLGWRALVAMNDDEYQYWWRSMILHHTQIIPNMIINGCYKPSLKVNLFFGFTTVYQWLVVMMAQGLDWDQ